MYFPLPRLLLGMTMLWASVVYGSVCDRFQDRALIDVRLAGARGDGIGDDTAALQTSIDCGTKIHRPVYLPPGDYRITQPLMLEEGLALYGNGRFSRLIVQSDTAMTMRTDAGADYLDIHDLTFVYRHPRPAPDHTALLLKSHSYSRFHNLYFYGFDRQIICRLQPSYRGRPARNIVFNTYRNWFVSRCRIGVIYEGMGRSGQKGPISVISNNRWYDITFRRVGENAIRAVSWADSERWYNLYAQAAEPDTVLIHLNTSATVWNQIDRFHFYSPVLVYAPELRDVPDLRVKAFRFGKGTFRHLVLGLITDKIWKQGLIQDDGALSYYILGNTGEGFRAPPAVIRKNYDLMPPVSERDVERF